MSTFVQPGVKQPGPSLGTPVWGTRLEFFEPKKIMIIIFACLNVFSFMTVGQSDLKKN